jgi:hypothetical protein
VIGMMQRGDLYPSAFAYPSVYYYMLLPVMYLHYFYLHARGSLFSPWDIILHHPQVPPAAYSWYISVPSFYLWGRVLNCLIATATVYLVYRLGKAIYGAAVGLLGAAFLAVAPGAVYYANIIHVDVPMAFFVTLTMLVGLNILRRGAVRDYVLTGVLAGVAISTKTNAIVVGTALAVVHVLNVHRKHLITARLVLMGLCAVIGFAAGTPYVWIRSAIVLQQIRAQTLAYAGIPSLHLIKSVLPRYLDYFIRPSRGDEWFVIPHTAFGLLPAAAAVVGAVVGYQLAPRAHVYLLTFPMTYIIFMSGQKLMTLRNMMAALPFVALFAAVACVWAWRFAQSRWEVTQARWAPGAAGLAIVVLLAAPARDSIWLGWAVGHPPDTRTAAVDWLSRHVAPGTRVAFEEDLRWFVPQLERLPFRMLYAPRDADIEWYLRQRVAFAVIGDRSPLQRLPAAAVFQRPPYIHSADVAPPDSYPIIDPTLYIVRPKIREINAVFPVHLDAEDMLLEPVVRQAVGVYSETIQLPDQRFEAGSYTINVAGAGPWLGASPSDQLDVEVMVGHLNVGKQNVGGAELLSFPFRIEKAQTLPIQLKVTLLTRYRKRQSALALRQSVWALRPSPAICAIAPDTPALNVKQLTVEAWVYLEGMHDPAGLHSTPGLESEGPILSKRTNEGYYLRLTGDSNNKIWVDLNVAGKWAVGRAGFVPFRKWTHVAATYDGHEAHVYINGSPAIQDPGRTPRYEGTIQSEGAPLSIGCRNPAVPNGVSFSGLITGVRLWNRVLAADEIRDEASIRRLPDTSPGLVGSWSFQSLTGGRVPDLSGAGNNITNGLSLKRVPVEGETPALPSRTFGQLNLIRTVEIQRAIP